MNRRRFHGGWAAVLILGAIVLAAAGCTSTKPGEEADENESAIPWNTPQQWEGAPSIPGMSQYQ